MARDRNLDDVAAFERAAAIASFKAEMALGRLILGLIAGAHALAMAVMQSPEARNGFVLALLAITAAWIARGIATAANGATPMFKAAKTMSILLAIFAGLILFRIPL